MYKRTKAFLFLMLLCLPVMLFAQEDNDPEIEPDWDVYETDLYSKGDQTFTISLGTVFPVLFKGRDENGKLVTIKEHNFSPPVGGTGSLSYNYFLNSRVFVGGEISGMFLPTISKDTAYIIPLGIRAGYQFYLWRFEFPLSVTLGVSWHRYLNDGYFGFFIKGGGAVYFRFNHEWSFGLNSNWCFLPEWTKEEYEENGKKKKRRTEQYDVFGNIVELTLSARYHF